MCPIRAQLPVNRNISVKSVEFISSSNNYTSEEPMNCFGRFSNTFASEGSPILLPKLGSVFLRTTIFVLQTDYFTRILA